MGSLNNHDIRTLKKDHGLTVLVETGSHQGSSVAYALKSGFQRIISIELLKELAHFCRERFHGNQSVEIINSESAKALDALLSSGKIIETDRVLWWLDAHLPQHYIQGGDEMKFANDVTFPLKRELNAITSNRNIQNDVFIIDDLRLYEDGPYENGNCEPKRPFKDSDFIFQVLQGTHAIKRDFRQEGYLAAVPKK